MSEQLKKIGIRTKEGANVKKVLYRLGNKDIWMFDWSEAKLKSKREPFRCILTNKLDDPKMFYLNNLYENNSLNVNFSPIHFLERLFGCIKVPFILTSK